MKRIVFFIVAFIMVFGLLQSTSTSIPVEASTSLSNEIYLSQEGTSTCTLSSAAMMLRSCMYLSGSEDWRSITESGIRSIAWKEGSGLRWGFTYDSNGNSITVSYSSVSDGISVSSLKSILNNHPEGIVLYCGNLLPRPHAVFVTDYEGDTFYCADPIASYSGKRISLSSSYLGKNCGSQSGVLNNVTAYWYVSSYSISSHTHSYTRYYESNHPHNIYEKCSCGDKRYTGETYRVKECSSCWYVEFDPLVSSITLRVGELYTLPVSISGCWPDTRYAAGEYDSNLLECRASSGQLTFTGLKSGSDVFKLSIYSDNTKSHLIGTLSIPITITPTSYTISYNANGGSGAPSSQAKEHGVSLTLSGAVPTRFGYTFLGWSTSSNATVATYEPGDNFSGNTNTTLYSVWKEATGIPTMSNSSFSVSIPFADGIVYYTIMPVLNGKYRFESTGNLDTIIKIYNSSGTILANSDDDGDNRNFLLTYELNVGVQYYVVIDLYGSDTGTVDFTVKRVYDIAYNANNGSGAPASQEKIHGTTLRLSTTIPTRNGYTFLGWSASSTETSTIYQPGGSFTGNANTTLYAVWKVNPTTLSVNSTNSAVISTGGEMKYFTYTPTASGEYVIYSTSSDDTKVYLYNASWTELDSDDDDGDSNNFRLEYNLTAGTTYIFGVKYYNSSKTGTISFKFGNVFTVTYNANNGSGAPSSQSKDYGTDITLSSTVPTRSGYTFLGWSTSSTTTSVTYQPGGSFTGNANTTLYAVWKQGCENGAHSYSYTATKAPTTAVTGTLTGTCSKCNSTTTVILPKLNTTDYNYSIIRAATCKSKGTGRYTWKITTYGNIYFETDIAATEHSYSYRTTKTPTASVTGTLIGTCSKCSDTETITLPKLSTTDYDYSIIRAATCESKGTGRYTWKITTYGNVYFETDITATEHSYSYKTTKTPTASVTGTLIGTCSKCSDTETVALPKLSTADYTYKVTQSETCAKTGTGRYTWKTTTYGSYYFDITIPKSEHNYTDTIIAPNCSESGYTQHSCTCGNIQKDTYTEALGHDYHYTLKTIPGVSQEGSVQGLCTVCSEVSVLKNIPPISEDVYECEIIKAPTATETGIAKYTWKDTVYGEISFEVVLEKSMSENENVNGNNNITENDSKKDDKKSRTKEHGLMTTVIVVSVIAFSAGIAVAYIFKKKK